MKSVLSALLVLCLAGCASSPPAPKAPPATAAAPIFLVRDPVFLLCEAEGLVAHDAARQALLFDQSQADMLTNAQGDASLTALINEIFRQAREEGLKEHAKFGAAQFYRCVEREGLTQVRNPNATICLARTDLVFFLNADRIRGKTPEEANQGLKKYLQNTSQAVYPPALVDQLTPMVYRIQNEDDHYDLRQFVFQTCLVPEDWKAWWNSTQQGKVE